MSRLELVFRESVFEKAGNYIPGARVEQESRWSFCVASEMLTLRVGCNSTNVVYVELDRAVAECIGLLARSRTCIYCTGISPGSVEVHCTRCAGLRELSASNDVWLLHKT